MFSDAGFVTIGKFVQKLKLITHIHEHVPVQGDMDMYTDA